MPIMDDRAKLYHRLRTCLAAVYPPAVVGLVVFVALAFLFPEPIRCYRSRAVVEQTVSVGDLEPTDLKLISRDDAEQLARQAWRIGVTSNSSADVDDAMFDDAVSIGVERLTPHRLRVTIDASDRYANRSLDLCERMAAEIVGRAEKSFVPGLHLLQSQRHDVQQRLALVREAKRVSEDELMSLEREHLTQFTSALGNAVGGKAATESGAAADEYAALQAEFQQLLLSRQELTRTRTNDHPLVKNADERLAQVQARLKPVQARLEPGIARLPDTQLRMETLQGEFRSRALELSGAVAQARRREEDLLTELARLTVSPEPLALRTGLIQPAQLVERSGGELPLLRIAACGVLAIAGGMATYRGLRLLAARQPLSSLDDIDQRLGLPVLSQIATAGLGPHSSLAPSRARKAIFAAELTLLVLVLVATLVIASQTGLTSPAAADPFGTVAEAFDRALSPTLRR